MAMNDKYALWFDSNKLSHDRAYGSADLRGFFEAFFDSGVFGKNTNELLVTSLGQLKVKRSAGMCLIQGAVRRFPNEEFDVPYGGTQPRYDCIVLQFNLAQRNIVCEYKKGTGSSTPAKYTPIQTLELYELPLCNIYVAANATSITQANIEDLRGQSICPYVTHAIGDIDTTGLFAQYEAQWELLKGACAQDAEAVIAAWEVLNAVKKVNGIAPVNGNISMPLNKVPDGGGYYKSPYYIQAGTYNATGGTATITFGTTYKNVPHVFTSYTTATSSNSIPMVTSRTKSGFTVSKGTSVAYAGFDWVAFGKI